MKEVLVSYLRRIRTLFYYLLWPFDWLWLTINRLHKYPPIYLRRHVHCLGTIDGTGAEFAAYLKILGELKSASRMLDLGCGCGLLELQLEDYVTSGQVVGVDIHSPSILWASRTIGKRKANFRFVHGDIYNSAYNPKGKGTARNFFEQFPDSAFDVIVAKSLFTHMLCEMALN